MLVVRVPVGGKGNELHVGPATRTSRMNEDDIEVPGVRFLKGVRTWLAGGRGDRGRTI